MSTLPSILPLKADMTEMLSEMLSPRNQQLTSQNVGHQATRNECAIHYISNGGLEHFRQTHQIAQMPVAA